jgi:hypothetical protein
LISLFCACATPSVRAMRTKETPVKKRGETRMKVSPKAATLLTTETMSPQHAEKMMAPAVVRVNLPS